MNKSLGKNSIYNIIYNVSNILLPLITSMYAARILLADGVGKVAYAQNIASYFIVLASWGFTTYGAREIAKTRVQTERNKFFTELMIINTITTLIAIVTYTLFIVLNARFRTEFPLYFFCGIQIYLNFINIEWLYSGNEDFKYITIRSIGVKLVSLILILLFVREKSDYTIYAMISALSLSANYVFNVFHAKKLIQLDFKDLDLKRHIMPLLILGTSIFLNRAYSKIDITMLGSMCSDSIVGIYNNAHKIVDMVISVSTSITAVFLPRLTYYYFNEREKFDGLIEIGIKVIGFIVFPAFFGLLILSPDVMVLMFGDSFAPGGRTLRIFSSLIIIKGFGDLLCYQLVLATGNEKKRLPAYFAAFLLLPVAFSS